MGQQRTVGAAFVAVTTLLFAWGFITSLIDPLVAAVKGIFTLTNIVAVSHGAEKASARVALRYDSSTT